MSFTLELITLLLSAAGVLLMLVAGLGILRMPDLPTRMHAASKAGTLGAALILLGVALHFKDPGLVVLVILICLFLFLTGPVAAHMIGRAAHRSGVPISRDTLLDELSEKEYGRDRRPRGDGKEV